MREGGGGEGELRQTLDVVRAESEAMGLRP